MEDPQVVAAILAGDPAGLAAAYDRYAMLLYAYCRSMLPEPADAADAVQDTFLAATAELRGLRDPARLRPWLYAVARNECLRRLRTRSLTATLDEAAELPADIEAADPAVWAERADLQALVRSAIDGLNLKDRDIVELSLVHELGGSDLADVLGVSSNHAHALLSRARSQMEKSLGALIVARSGRHSCPELAAMLDGWDGQLTVLMRKRINRHLERCTTCDERKRRELSPALLVGVAPVAALLPGFREQVLRVAMAGRAPATLTHRILTAHRVVPSGSSGFPRARRVPGAHWRSAAVHQSHVLAAGTVTSALAIGAVVVVGIGGPHPGMPPSAAGSTHGAAVPSRPGAGSGRISPVLSVQAAPGSPGTAGQTGTPRPSGQLGTPTSTASGQASPSSATPAPSTGTASPSPSSGTGTASPGTPSPSPSPITPSPSPSPGVPSPSPSPTPPPPSQGTLSVSPAVLDPVNLNGTPIGSLTLTAVGGPVSDYSVSVGPALVGQIAVSPSSGSLAAGASVTITVTVTSLLAVNAQITVNPGNLTVEVLVGL